MRRALNLQIASRNILAVFTILQCPKHIGGFLSSSFLSVPLVIVLTAPQVDEWFLKVISLSLRTLEFSSPDP